MLGCSPYVTFLLALRKVSLTSRSAPGAVHWFAASQAQPELENRLLNPMTSLEVLIGPEDDSSIAATVSERTALYRRSTDEYARK